VVTFITAIRHLARVPRPLYAVLPNVVAHLSSQVYQSPYASGQGAPAVGIYFLTKVNW